MGEKQTKPFQLSFNGSLKVDFQGSHVTSDGGLILVRELDERLGLGELIHATSNFGDVIVGTMYGLVDGAVGGAVIAWLYNRLAGRGSSEG